MQALTSFFSHYLSTYNAYLHSSIIWEVLAIYCVVMTLTIVHMIKIDSFKYFLPVLLTSITASSVVYTYTFWSLW